MALVPVFFLYLIVAYLLRKIVRSARDGKSFTFENVRRIRLIGIIIMLTGPLYSMVFYYISLLYIKYIVLPGTVVNAGMNVTTTINMLLLGLLVLVSISDLRRVFEGG